MKPIFNPMKELISPAIFKKYLCKEKFNLPPLEKFVFDTGGYHLPFERPGRIRATRWKHLTALLMFLLVYSARNEKTGIIFTQADALINTIRKVGLNIGRSVLYKHLADLEAYGFLYRETVYAENDLGGTTKRGILLIVSNWYLKHIQNSNTPYDGHYLTHVCIENDFIPRLVGKRYKDADSIFGYLTESARKIFLTRRDWTISKLKDTCRIDKINKTNIHPLERLFVYLPVKVLQKNLFDEYYIESFFCEKSRRWKEDKIFIDLQVNKLVFDNAFNCVLHETLLYT